MLEICTALIVIATITETDRRYITDYKKKFWKELICLHPLPYLKMSFELKPVVAPT
jgi:hypothetical protein